MLDRLQFGLVLYGLKGSIVALNRQAEHLLARCRSLILRGDTLYCHDALQRRRFAKLLADAAIGIGGVLLIQAAGDPPLTLLGIPLGDAPASLDVCGNSEACDTPSTHFAIALGMRDVSFTMALEAFAELYKLTPAELRVLDGLSRDHSPGDVAEHSRVSVRTVRTQLSSIYSKTHTRGQRQLLSRLREIPPFSFK